MSEPSDGALSIDQAAALIAPEQPDEAPEATPEPVEEVEETPEPEPAEEAPDEPLEADEEPEGEVEEAEEVEDAAPVVDPPYYWPADAKAKFAKLPADLQELVAEQEKGRDTAIRTAQEQMAVARKAAEAEANKFIQQGPKIEALLNEVQSAYKANDWETVDWAAWADQDPTAALKGKLLYEAQTRQMQQLETARQTAEDESFRAYTIEQAGELQRLAPDIAANDAKRADIVNYLIKDNGYDQDLIRGIRAKDVVIAYKAMLYDRDQAKSKSMAVKGAERPAQPTPRVTQSSATVRPVRPGTGSTAPSPKRAVVEREAAFKAKPSIDNAVAMLLARGTG